VLRLVEILQPPLTKIDDRHARGQVLLGQLLRRRRQQHLAAVPGHPDPRRTMHTNPDIAIGAATRLAGVQPHPHPDLDARRPRLGEQVALRVDSRRNGVLRCLEGDEERIPLIVDLAPAVHGERRTQNPVMFREQLRVLGTELFQEPSRSLHVGEEERDGPARELGHSTAFRLPTTSLEHNRRVA
jgi:hypothetical protein